MGKTEQEHKRLIERVTPVKKNKKQGWAGRALTTEQIPQSLGQPNVSSRAKIAWQRSRTLGRNSQTPEPYYAQSLTGGYLERVAFSPKLRRILNNEWQEAVSTSVLPAGEWHVISWRETKAVHLHRCAQNIPLIAEQPLEMALPFLFSHFLFHQHLKIPLFWIKVI